MREFIVLAFIVYNWNGILATSTTPAPLSFVCDKAGHITNITANNVAQEQIVLVDPGTPCHISQPSCNWQNKTKLRIFYDENEKSPLIIAASKAHFYDLECARDFNESVTAQISQIQSFPTPTPTYFRQDNVPHSSIKLSILKGNNSVTNNVQVGDQLTLQLQGPDKYTIDLLNCIAFKNQTHQDGYKLWDNAYCKSSDKAIMGDTWNATVNQISISFFAFKFVDTETVIIECSAHFCPQNTCNATCPISGTRRRRSIHIESRPVLDSIDGSARASYTIALVNTDANYSPGLAMSVVVSMFAVVTSRTLIKIHV